LLTEPVGNAEGRERGRGSWKACSKLEGLGEHCKNPAGFWSEPDHFGRTKSPENVSSGRKCRLVLVSRFDSAEVAEPFNATGGTRLKTLICVLNSV